MVAGEFNSGKSTFINALLGRDVLPTGVTPTTDRIHVLRWDREPGEREVEDFVVERTHPAELLREIEVVDTPGTNAVIRRHEELTRDFLPRCDLVLFVTSADRPFTESERAFLEQIREWGKKIVFVINKVDILEEDEDRERVRRYVLDNAIPLLGREPELFAVSARSAMRARDAEGEEAERLWRDSGMPEVETYLLETLDAEERIRLKLLNPLNVGLRLAGRYADLAFERLKLLADDVEAIRAIDDQLARFHQEMLEEYEDRLARLDGVLRDMERRGEAFFEETIRIGRIRTLLDSDQVRRAFEREVIGETPERIDQEVDRIIDWLVERNQRVWQQVQTYVDRRRLEKYEDRMVGRVGDSFDYNRRALLDSVGRASREVLVAYDRDSEARKIANEVQGTFATAALAEAGAVGMGTLVATVLTGAVADLTGILLATGLAVGGFYVIPRKRRQAKERFAKQVEEMRRDLTRTLTRQVHDEVTRAQERMREAIAPYRRFVESQRERLEEARGELVAVRDALERLRGEIEGQGR